MFILKVEIRIRNKTTGLFANGIFPLGWDETGKIFKSIDQLKRYIKTIGELSFTKMIRIKYHMVSYCYEDWELVDCSETLESILKQVWKV